MEGNLVMWYARNPKDCFSNFLKNLSLRIAPIEQDTNKTNVGYRILILPKGIIIIIAWGGKRKK